MQLVAGFLLKVLVDCFVKGKRLDDNLKLVGEGFNLASVPSRGDIYDDRFLPPAGARKFAD